MKEPEDKTADNWQTVQKQSFTEWVSDSSNYLIFNFPPTLWVFRIQISKLAVLK